MKHTLSAILLLLPSLAAAYPDPNVTAAPSSGDVIKSILSQPTTDPLVTSDASAAF
ncbi:hypothetical protein [Marivita sp.]|uniref:hypothetical protein n=1 Tax=Marivita sp. TaxID=2003365 RepID=UPI003F6BAC44